MVVNGKQIAAAHVAKLRANPEMADLFDQKYGPGTSSAILGGGGKSKSKEDFEDIMAW